MGVERAAVLYPRNATTVDTGTGIDVRVLDDTNGGTAENQSCTCAHTADNTERTWDPATTGFNSVLDSRNLQKLGWALRLTEDMTPTDDTNCNVLLPAGTLTIGIRVSLAASGGTGYVGGTHTPTFRATLLTYDPATDTGTVIASGSTTALSWDLTPATGDGGALKNTTFSIVVPAAVEFPQGSVLLLQVGCNTGTLANPVTGTTTYTFSLRTDAAATNITWAAGQILTSLCAMTGTATGSGAATGDAGKVLNTVGAATGSGAAAGVGGARADTTGSANGTTNVAGAASAVAATTGAAAGTGSAVGVTGATGAMIGTAAGTGSAVGALGATGAMTGAAAGAGAAVGAMSARADMVGAAVGAGVAAGLASSVAGTTGAAAGAGVANGQASSVLGTVGTVEIGAEGSETPVTRKIFPVFD